MHRVGGKNKTMNSSSFHVGMLNGKLEDPVTKKKQQTCEIKIDKADCFLLRSSTGLAAVAAHSDIRNTAAVQDTKNPGHTGC